MRTLSLSLSLSLFGSENPLTGHITLITLQVLHQSYQLFEVTEAKY
jgi:hypothetical protein